MVETTFLNFVRYNAVEFEIEVRICTGRSRKAIDVDIESRIHIKAFHVAGHLKMQCLPLCFLVVGQRGAA